MRTPIFQGIKYHLTRNEYQITITTHFQGQKVLLNFCPKKGAITSGIGVGVDTAFQSLKDLRLLIF